MNSTLPIHQPQCLVSFPQDVLPLDLPSGDPKLIFDKLSVTLSNIPTSRQRIICDQLHHLVQDRRYDFKSKHSSHYRAYVTLMVPFGAPLAHPVIVQVGPYDAGEPTSGSSSIQTMSDPKALPI